MTRSQDCPLTQQAVGWALHALEPDEEMAVLLHLPQCEVCQAAVLDAEQILAGLGATVTLLTPPASLRDRLMAEVAETPQRPPILRPRSSPETSGTDAAVADAPGRVDAPAPARRHRLDAEDASSPSRPARWIRAWTGSRGRRLVAASLAVVAVLSVGGLVVRTTQLEQQRDAETAQAQGLSELIGQLGEPGSRHALLTDSDTGAIVAAVLVSDGERQVYSVGLPANPADSTYVAWGQNPGADPVPLGAFDVDAADQGMRTIGSTAEAGKFTGYAISLEPGRVPPASPTRVVASGQVAS
ncbi:MAG: anti-sigma factor [Pseudonocardia sp.]|nr:anti-sigma factor [Pseudonocardia sp.]